MGKTHGWGLLGLSLVAAIAAAACGSPSHGGTGTGPDDNEAPDSGSPAGNGDSGTPPSTTGPQCTGDPLALLDQGSTQLAKLCARGYGDPVTKAFCGSSPPTITNVTEMLAVLGMKFGPPPYLQGKTSGVNGNPAFILTAQTASITTRKVSQINPRAFFFTTPLARGRMTGPPKPNPSYVAMTFARGDQAFEILAKDPTMNGGKGDIRFFLLKYEQACNAAPGGCTPGDLYTPAVESNFTGWSLYSDDDLKNTTLDCLQCHQPNGPGTPRMLRFQELQRPWTHWMYQDAIGIDALRADFHAAHPADEPYAGIPAGALDHGDVQQLEGFVENNGFQVQPNEFLGAPIASELSASGSSATWHALYQGSENGQFIPVPYYDFKATDPMMVATMVAQYNAVATGKMPASQLGDMTAVFNDTAQRAMTHKPALGLTGRQILTQICQECHNSRLDQTVSRANFNVETLDSLPRSEKDEAIRRINLPMDACNHMPPVRFRELDASEIALVQAELQK